MVFVHGWACDGSFWYEQTVAFAQRWRVIVLDLPGHGESEPATVTYTPDYLAHGLDAVLRDAGVSRAVPCPADIQFRRTTGGFIKKRHERTTLLHTAIRVKYLFIGIRVCIVRTVLRVVLAPECIRWKRLPLL